MPTISHLDLSKDSPKHPLISQLVRLINEADPFTMAEGKDFVILAGPNDQFTFTETAGGYLLKKSK